MLSDHPLTNQPGPTGPVAIVLLDDVGYEIAVRRRRRKVGRDDQLRDVRN
jgi:hypothetical protein